jgi:hypothetical protein
MVKAPKHDPLLEATIAEATKYCEEASLRVFRGAAMQVAWELLELRLSRQINRERGNA